MSDGSNPIRPNAEFPRDPEMLASMTPVEAIEDGVKRLDRDLWKLFKEQFGNDFEKLAEENQVVVFHAATDLAQQHLNLLAFPDERDRWRSNIAHIKGTLLNVRAIAAIATFSRLQLVTKQALANALEMAFNLTV